MLSECLMSLIQTFIWKTSVLLTISNQGRSNNDAYKENGKLRVSS